MKPGMLFSAFFYKRNLVFLCLLLAAAYTVGTYLHGPELYAAYTACAVLYVISVVQSLMSRKFHEKYNRRQKIKHIRDLDYKCIKLASDAKKSINPTYAQKLKKVMNDKNDIINSFFRGQDNYLKEKIVEQTLNLVLAYIKLLTNYCMRNRELSSIDVGDIANRINMNMRKLNFTKDPIAANDIKKVIEMDEKIISRLKEEKKELERIGAKLDYMESTVNMFKHQILSNIETEEMLEKLETVVNEASALDIVLDERRKNKAKL